METIRLRSNSWIVDNKVLENNIDFLHNAALSSFLERDIKRDNAKDIIRRQPHQRNRPKIVNKCFVFVKKLAECMADAFLT